MTSRCYDAKGGFLMTNSRGVTNSPHLVDAGRRVLSTSSLSSIPSSSRVTSGALIDVFGLAVS